MVRLALVGFGHVGRAFAHLLLRQDKALRDEHGLQCGVTAIVTRSHGWICGDSGVDLPALLARPELPERGPAPPIASLPVDVLVEVSTLNPRDGQPALDHVREALRARMHVITANKGPIAHAYRELRDLAQHAGRELRFEATVADDLPVFNLARYALSTARILSLRGIVNSTTNYLLSEAARGKAFGLALQEAQRLGIAERDPSLDLEGWDAAVKASILATVLPRSRLGVAEVVREPINEAVADRAAQVARDGKRLRPVLRVDHHQARWGPAVLSPGDVLYAVDGLSMALELETDVAGRLTVMLHDPHVEQVAFALLADLVGLSAP